MKLRCIGCRNVNIILMFLFQTGQIEQPQGRRGGGGDLGVSNSIFRQQKLVKVRLLPQRGGGGYLEVNSKFIELMG